MRNYLTGVKHRVHYSFSLPLGYITLIALDCYKLPPSPYIVDKINPENIIVYARKDFNNMGSMYPVKPVIRIDVNRL